MPRKQKHFLRSAMALALAAALTFAGCGVQGTPLSGQDADSISVTPAADEVLETTAENGKTYDYFWLGEMSAEELWEMVLAEEAADLIEHEGREPTEQELEQARAQFDKEYEAELQRIAALDPILSPQEAANIAGMAIENGYGADLSGGLRLDCMTTSVNGTERVVWDVETVRSESEPQISGHCTVDATTGRILAMSCVPSWQEIAAIGAAPLRSFITEDGNGRYTYPTSSEGEDWNAFLNQVTAQGEAFLAQIGLDKELAEPANLIFKGSQMFLVLRYKDGSTGRMELTWSILEHQYGDEDPYPGKWFNLYISSQAAV